MGLHFGQTSRPLLCATGEPENEDVLQGGCCRLCQAGCAQRSPSPGCQLQSLPAACVGCLSLQAWQALRGSSFARIIRAGKQVAASRRGTLLVRSRPPLTRCPTCPLPRLCCLWPCCPCRRAQPGLHRPAAQLRVSEAHAVRHPALAAPLLPPLPAARPAPQPAAHHRDHGKGKHGAAGAARAAAGSPPGHAPFLGCPAWPLRLNTTNFTITYMG